MKVLKRLKDKLKERVEDGAIAALAIGTLSQALGIDIAPGEVDIILSAVATILVVVRRWRASRELR